MLRVILASEGYDTETILDGSAAVERLGGEPADLVLLDVMMPGVDGFEVLRRMRSTDGWEDIPVVVVTALTTDEDQWTGWQAGADYYLTKPFDIEELRSVVVRLLATGQVVPYAPDDDPDAAQEGEGDDGAGEGDEDGTPEVAPPS